MRWATEIEYLGTLLINCTQAPKASEMSNLAYILKMSYLDRTLGMLERHFIIVVVVPHVVVTLNESRAGMETGAATSNL